MRKEEGGGARKQNKGGEREQAEGGSKEVGVEIVYNPLQQEFTSPRQR